MPRIRTAERALTLLASSSTTTTSQQYICRACRQHALVRRTLHTSAPLRAEESFITRIRRSVFGSKESKEAGVRRTEARQKQVQELAQQGEGRRKRGKTIVDPAQRRQWEVAPLVDGSLDEGYVPATTWEGLDRVGGEAWVRGRADGGEVYRGFSLPKKVSFGDEQWKGLLHHVAVEVLALREAGRDVDKVCNQRADARTWETTSKVTIAIDGDAVVLTPTEQISIQDVLMNIPDVAQEAGQRTPHLLTAEVRGAAGKGEGRSAAIAQNDDAWMQLPLSDPILKLAILKRTSQLSGHRPGDATVSSATTLADLHAAFKPKEKPKKLRESPKMTALNAENPNVTVHGRRQTPIDKHREVGRWKVIAEELERRNLPVVGSRWVGAKTAFGPAEGMGAGGKKKKGKKGKSVT